MSSFTSGAPVPTIVKCLDQMKEFHFTTWTSYADAIEALEPIFGTITRIQGAKVAEGDYVDLNDKDAWIHFLISWEQQPIDGPIPTLYIQLTVERHEVVLSSATAAAGVILDRAFNADMGRRHDAGPFPWTQNEMIGRGGRGIVYKGTKDDGDLVAVKAIDISTDRAAYLCALELDLLNRMDHPNVVRLLGSYEDPLKSTYYIILEYMGRGSLRHHLDTMEGALADAVIRNYMRQILTGIVYLHSLDIVHRDIKAANVLINDNDVLKLADFDVSKELPSDRAQSSCRSVIGSPYWFAPELCLNKPYGRKVDIWAAGCVLVEMLTKALPWENFLCIQAAITIIGEATKPPTNLPDCLPEPLHSFADHCFQRDPADRPTAEELLKHPYLV